MSAGRAIGVVRELWRYPVKSLGGERVVESGIELRDGVVGDRCHAIRDVAAGEIRGAKKIPELMQLGARYLEAPRRDGDTPIEIDLGDGQRVRSDDPQVAQCLGERLGRLVELCRRRPASDLAHYLRARPITDPESEIRAASELLPEESIPGMAAPPPVDLSIVGQYVSPPGTYFDFFDLHLVSTASLARLASLLPDSQIEARRFRPNLVVELEPRSAGSDRPNESAHGGVWPELAWLGSVLVIGQARVEITMPMMRCGMTTHAQPGLAKDPRIMRALVRDCGLNLGAGATVRGRGLVRVGDAIRVEN